MYPTYFNGNEKKVEKHKSLKTLFFSTVFPVMKVIPFLIGIRRIKSGENIPTRRKTVSYWLP